MSEGIANLAVAEYPTAFWTTSKADMAEKVQTTLVDNVIEGLTKTKESPVATRRSESKPEDIVYRGTLDEVNRFFSQKGWTDEMPIIPPTVDRIEKFLKYTALPPDKVVAVLPASNLQATVWKIAVNGVMAGCRPEHMPLLVAGVEAMSVPRYNLGQIGTTWALYPYFLVNGPIIKQLGLEYGVGLVSRGPNPALGRAFNLIIRNLAGFKPGLTRMGTWGYVPPLLLAEDEEFLARIGWKPYHVEEGFDANTSTVTVGGAWSWGDQISMNFVGGIEKAERLLDAIAFDLIRKVVPLAGLEGGPQGVGTITVLLSPPTAEFIHAGGYSRRDIVDYLFAKTKRTVAEWAKWWVRMGARPEVPLTRLRGYVQEGTLPSNLFNQTGKKNVPIIPNPQEHLKVFVCGDRARDKTMTLYGWYLSPVTKKIDLPQHWEHLLKETIA